MAQRRRQSNQPDPFAQLLDGLFKGIWYLVSLPFRNKKADADLARVKAEFQQHWQQIETWASAGQWREAVMQADILLDKALQQRGVAGNTLGERLKSSTTRLNKDILDAAWSAHKVRNQLAHELHYRLGEPEARQAMNNFKKVIRELGLL